MKKVFVLLVVLMAGVSMQVSAHAGSDTTWTKSKANKWFKKKEWLHGVALTPHASINKVEFARQYQANKDWWDKAFVFLKEHDLQTLAKGKYPIDGDNVFASVTEDPSKDFDKTGWESHRKYIDVQCVIIGEEKMGKSPVAEATVTKPYDESKDVANYTASGKFYTLPAGTFIIFFPADAHRPNISPDGNKKVVKKIVIKVRAA
jgi:YhcH/YjgK/YiaL family protein